MNLVKSYNTEQSLVQFVTDFNKNDSYNSFPIIGFQFVSLDDVENGKMVWWNYLHKEIAQKYVEVLNKFTGKAAKDGIYAQVKGDSSVKVADPEGLSALDKAEPDLVEPAVAAPAKK